MEDKHHHQMQIDVIAILFYIKYIFDVIEFEF